MHSVLSNYTLFSRKGSTCPFHWHCLQLGFFTRCLTVDPSVWRTLCTVPFAASVVLLVQKFVRCRNSHPARTIHQVSHVATCFALLLQSSVQTLRGPPSVSVAGATANTSRLVPVHFLQTLRSTFGGVVSVRRAGFWFRLLPAVSEHIVSLFLSHHSVRVVCHR